MVARADVTSACSAAEADDSGDSFSWLINILRHQPFTPNYASTTSPDIANLSSLLAEQPESEQTEFLLLILKVAPSMYLKIKYNKNIRYRSDLHGGPSFRTPVNLAPNAVLITCPGAEDTFQKASQPAEGCRG